jgi:ribosome-binding protein aMBF1 (putative translation factor)
MNPKRKDPPTPFAQGVRTARDALGWSQAQLAAHLVVAPGTIYRIEKGMRPASVVERKLRTWCRMLPALPVIEAPATDLSEQRPTGT